MGNHGTAMSPERATSPVGVVVECEVADFVPAILEHGAGTDALVLVRIFSEPIGLLKRTLPPDGLKAHELARLIVGEFGAQLRRRIEDCGLRWTGELPISGLGPPGPQASFRAARVSCARVRRSRSRSAPVTDRKTWRFSSTASTSRTTRGCASWWSTMPPRTTARGASCRRLHEGANRVRRRVPARALMGAESRD